MLRYATLPYPYNSPKHINSIWEDSAGSATPSPDDRGHSFWFLLLKEMSDILSEKVSIPLLSFGLVGDPQYAPVEDGAQYGDPSRVRRFRNSAQIVERAVDYFTKASTTYNIICGDILDARTKKVDAIDSSLQMMESIIRDTYAKSAGTTQHPPYSFVCGNHDFFLLNRDVIYRNDFFTPPWIKAQCSPSQLYYSFSPQKGFRFVFLDLYEISVDGGLNEACKQEARDILNKENINIATDQHDWLQGLPEEKKRFVPYNGDMSTHQYLWLTQTLQTACDNDEKVFVFCHNPLYMKGCRPSALSFRAEQIMETIYTSTATKGNVIAVISGHDHDGGYALDDHKIHHIVLPAPLEAPIDGNDYGIMHCYDDHFVLNWEGRLPKMILDDVRVWNAQSMSYPIYNHSTTSAIFDKDSMTSELDDS